MEKWIEANGCKLLLLAGLFTLWCFYSVVHQGGSVIPRIQVLEQNVKTHKQWAEGFSYRLREHTHRYHDGKVN